MLMFFASKNYEFQYKFTVKNCKRTFPEVPTHHKLLYFIKVILFLIIFVISIALF